ncbi:tail fiber assembly protein [Rouxiella sp. Mn2063]|uniref:tail fiber assembly protein n=1 Tax=Rouxiella sp. Mn2063 TaxID=3395262 RepID=UPI003BCDD6DE
MRYSPGAQGFYPEDIDYGSNLPKDVVSISNELYLSLLEGQSNGKVITPGDDGIPFLAEPPEPTKEELISAADKEKESILQGINSKTQIWQTQLALGIISAEDKKTLISWMKYAQKVQSVDTSTAPDIEWPDHP